MKFLTMLSSDGQELPSVLSPDGRHVLSLKELGLDFTSLLEFIEASGPEALPALERQLQSAVGGVPLSEIRLAAPIPHPRHDLLCLGLNYREHVLESGLFGGPSGEMPACPVYFSKRVDRAVATGEPIPAHGDITAELDYEAELAVVIGRRCDHVPREEVRDHIFGYTVVNDVTAREIQRAHAQYTFGKSLDGFTPMGPWIVTADELPYPPRLGVRSWVNGQLRQDGSTADFLFGIDYVVSELSAGIVLRPGDIISTGTPSGVGMGMSPPVFLKPGDTVRCEVEGVGAIENRVK